VRNAAETFGLERELMGRWENLKTRGGPVRLVKGQYRGRHRDSKAPGGREPPRTTGNTATPTGGSRGPSPSRSPWLTSSRTFTVSPTP